MMFKDKYPEFAAIEEHIRAARVERAVYLSQVIVGAVQSVLEGIRRLGTFAARSVEAERDRRSIEADAFLKRSVPRY